MNNLPQLYHGIINVGDLPIPFDMVLNFMGFFVDWGAGSRTSFWRSICKI